MNTHTETAVKIDFSRGQVIQPTVIFDGVEIESKSFHKDTHQIEELLDYVAFNEMGGCDVFI